MIGSANTLVTTDRGAGEALLLGRKQYGPDRGRLVLPGGKGTEAVLPEDIDPSPLYAAELPQQIAVRETLEETGLQLPVPGMHYLGHLMISKQAHHKGLVHVQDDYHVALFRSRISPAQAALARNSNELALEWHPTDQLPYDQMQPDTPAWLPLALTLQEGETLQGFITYLDDTPVEQDIFAFRQGQRAVRLTAAG